LFLDEVGAMHPALQTSLLRALQEHEIRRVGGRHPIPVDVRVVAATHDDLAKLVEKGTFRRDLYYRLNVFKIDLPPLRERREDIPPLAEHFLRAIGARERGAPPCLSEGALQRLVGAEWPGNIRELQS